MRIVFMGTPDFAVPSLAELITAGHEIVAVFTQPDRPKGRGQKVLTTPIKDFALTKNLPIWQPKSVKQPEVLEELEKMQPDFIVVVAFGQLLPKNILALPKYACLNVHASILPKYRGAAPIHWALINGEEQTGVTIMQLDIGMDTGDTFTTSVTNISRDMTMLELHDHLKIDGAKLLQQTIEKIVSGELKSKPQAHELATYAPLLTKDIEKIDWQQSAKNIHNKIRGLNTWPGAYASQPDGARLKIWASKLTTEVSSGFPVGTVVKVTEQGAIIQTGEDTCLEIVQVQPESRKKISMLDYIQGYKIKVGDQLN